MSFTLRSGLVVGIGLARGDTGTFDGRIGIGSTLEEASRVPGAGDTPNRVFRVTGRPGIGLPPVDIWRHRSDGFRFDTSGRDTIPGAPLPVE